MCWRVLLGGLKAGFVKLSFLCFGERQLVFLLPAIFILPLFFDLNGVFLAWPVSDFLSSIVTLIFLLLELKLINKSISSADIERA